MEWKRAFRDKMEVSFEWRIAGYNVVDSAEDIVAPVTDILCDAKRNRPRYLITEVGGLMSIKGKMVLLPVGMLTRAGSGQMIAKTTFSHIQQAPFIDDPDNPSRFEEEAIFSHFGLTPYWKTEPEDEPEDEDKEEDEKPEEEPEAG